jgi:hypothetical protein
VLLTRRAPFNPLFDPGAPGLRALRFDRAHRPERVEGRLSKGNPKSEIPGAAGSYARPREVMHIKVCT